MAFTLLDLEPEPPRDFTRADGTVWRRTGHCSLCGDCCHDDDDPSNEGYCAKATWVNDGVGGKIFHCCDHGKAGTYWAQGCCDWPTKPEHLIGMPHCTYVFTQVS